LIRAAIGDREYEIKADSIAKVTPSKCRGGATGLPMNISTPPPRPPRRQPPDSFRLPFPQRAFAQSISALAGLSGMKPFCRPCEVLKRLVKPDDGEQRARARARVRGLYPIKY